MGMLIKRLQESLKQINEKLTDIIKRTRS